MHPTNESSAMMNNLIQLGVIDPTLSPCVGSPLTPSYLSWFAKQSDRPGHIWDQSTMRPWTASQSTRWQEHRFDMATHTTVADYWAVELARFVVPQGQIGYVKYIEQVVNDIQGNYYPTNVAYWGSPSFVLSDVDNLRWYLKLSFYPGFYPPRWQMFSTIPIPPHILPGQPYPDLPQIDALWYPAHNCKSLKLLVPGAMMLRFYLLSPPLTFYQWEVSGKLSGWTQSTYQQSAIVNAREI